MSTSDVAGSASECGGGAFRFEGVLRGQRSQCGFFERSLESGGKDFSGRALPYEGLSLDLGFQGRTQSADLIQEFGERPGGDTIWCFKSIRQDSGPGEGRTA